MVTRCARLAEAHSNPSLDNQQADGPLPKILGGRRANLIGDFSSWMGSGSSSISRFFFFVPVQLDPPPKKNRSSPERHALHGAIIQTPLPWVGFRRFSNPEWQWRKTRRRRRLTRWPPTGTMSDASSGHQNVSRRSYSRGKQARCYQRRVRSDQASLSRLCRLQNHGTIW